MRAQILPSTVLLLCWLAGVKSDNTPLVPSPANGTISTSRTTPASTSDTSSITQPPSSRSSGTQAVPTFTGNRDDLVDWCFSLYDAFLNASGSVSSKTSSYTETWTRFVTDSTTLTTFTTTQTFSTTVVPTPYTPPPDCFTGCIIVADRVRLEYWPTPRANGTTSSEPTITPAPVVTAVVDGMTLYSPSNYLVYTDLTALACPLDSSPCTTIGEVVHEVTLSFGQNELKTENCFHAFDTFNYADFNTPIPWSIVSTQIGCTLITESHPGSEPDYDFTLMPEILFPQAVRTDVNPDWASCTFINAAYDPPSALTPVHALTTAPSPGTTPDPPANPTPTVTPTIASPLPETTLSPQDPPAPPVSDPDPAASSVNVDPSAPPADPGTSPTNPPADPPTQSNPADPGSPTNPSTTAAAPPNDPGSSTQGGSIGSIIGSLGGFDSPDPTPSSTITLPGQIPGAVPQTPILTTVPGAVTSIDGILTTLPGVVVTASPSATSPVIVAIGANTITIAPDGGSAVIGTQTVTAGGSPITVSSTVISLGPSGIVVGTSTVALATPTASGTDAGHNVATVTPSGLEQASIGSFLGSKGVWMALTLDFSCWLLFRWL